MKTVYYFGDDYYWKSGTMMGSLYTDRGERYDWGALQHDVLNGLEVLVKPASAEMREWADSKLRELES